MMPRTSGSGPADDLEAKPKSSLAVVVARTRRSTAGGRDAVQYCVCVAGLDHMQRVRDGEGLDRDL